MLQREQIKDESGRNFYVSTSEDGTLVTFEVMENNSFAPAKEFPLSVLAQTLDLLDKDESISEKAAELVGDARKGLGGFFKKVGDSIGG